MRLYECVLIFDVQMTDGARDGLIQEVTAIITDSGGSLVEAVPFGVRKIAFEVKGRTRGDYRIIRFTTSGQTLQRLDRFLRLKEDVIRYMVSRYYPPKAAEDSKRKDRQKPKVEEAAQPEGVTEHGQFEQSVSDR